MKNRYSIEREGSVLHVRELDRPTGTFWSFGPGAVIATGTSVLAASVLVLLATDGVPLLGSPATSATWFVLVVAVAEVVTLGRREALSLDLPSSAMGDLRDFTLADGERQVVGQDVVDALVWAVHPPWWAKRNAST